MERMKARDAIDKIKKERGVTQAELAKLAGMTGQTTVSEYLKRDMKISVFVRLVNALGYDVVLKKKTRGQPKATDANLIAVTDGVEI